MAFATWMFVSESKFGCSGLDQDRLAGRNIRLFNILIPAARVPTAGPLRCSYLAYRVLEPGSLNAIHKDEAMRNRSDPIDVHIN